MSAGEDEVEGLGLDIGGYHRPVTTNSPEAEGLVDIGFAWLYGFNHEEAARCFNGAIDADGDCGMAYWGLAYAVGPNYNKPWDLFNRTERQGAVVTAWRALQDAVKLDADLKPVELALLDALRHRYPLEAAPKLDVVNQWNWDYADAMAGVFSKFSDDLDVVALYAEAMMVLTPWRLWDLETGEPPEGARTLEIRRVLEHGMSLPTGMEHPGVLHMYVHLMEMSQNPEVAMPAASRLRTLMPDIGHLSHMPSHIDVLVGRYANAVIANKTAIVADDQFFARQGPNTFYTLYRCHNYHFCLYAAMFSAQSKIALETVTQLEKTITKELLEIRSPPMADWLEGFLAMRVHVLIRFGRWEDAIALEIPKNKDLYCTTTAMIHYAKGVAFAALGNVPQAERQRALFRDAVPNVKPTRTLFNNRCIDLLIVAEALLDGEIDYRADRYDTAYAHLRDAIALYDNLPFDEPWGWMQPVRHAYGALLLEQGHVKEALAVYKADLGLDGSLPRTHHHPNNVWALHGYHECLVKLGRIESAKEILPRLQEALEIADVDITSSCFCRTNAFKTAEPKCAGSTCAGSQKTSKI